MKRSVVVAAFFALPGLFSAAQGAEATGNLDGVNLGEHWYGPSLSLEDLKGRVVLLEFWGYN